MNKAAGPAFACLATPRRAAAQVTDIPGSIGARAGTELVGNRYLLRENVELEQASLKFYADVSSISPIKTMVARATCC
jgi:hypothetical protein